ncbi:MAG: NAD(P)/FAD-dependent oxidoreductase [bacterium]|jgi:thioredoxin reductase (NADPH)
MELHETTSDFAPAFGDAPDLTIVGAGPCGLFAAFYAGMRGMKTVIIDSLPQLGGQLTSIYPEKYVYDVAGFPKILAKELSAALVEQALGFGPEVHLEEKIIGVERMSGIALMDGASPAGGARFAMHDGSKDPAAGPRSIIKLSSQTGRSFYSKTVILALGAGAFMPKKLKLAEAEKFEAHGVHYVITDKSRFNGKRVLIVGGGDSAVDWAIELGKIAKKTTLIHRHDKWRAHEATVAWMMSGPVEVRTFWELKSILGEDHVRAALVFNNKTGEEDLLEVDDIVVCMGFLVDLRFLRSWGFEIKDNALSVNQQMLTSMEGVYGCGDIVTHPGKIKLITTGQGEAAVAVNFAYAYLNPGASVFPGHSSNLDIPFAKK